MKNPFHVNIVEEYKPFDHNSAATEIAKTLTQESDLSGRVFAITGTTLDSLGYFTAKALVDRNAEVILLNRSAGRMKDTADEIVKSQPTGCTGRLYQVVCDLARQASVREAVDEVKKILDERQLPLDCLICSAGRYFKEKQLSEDGYEMTMAIDHYGHFALAIPLLERMKENGRVVMVSSLNHTKVKDFPMDDLKFENQKYTWLESHNRAKLANLMFSFQLNNVLEAAGSKIVAYGLHPGAAKTNFAMEEGFLLRNVLKLTNFMFGTSADAAAGTTVFAALHPGLEGKRKSYLAQCGISDEINPLLKDEALLKSFFDHSLEATNLQLPTFGEG